MMKSLLLRVDASEELGMGHFMRSLALAQAWRAATGDAVRFLATALPPGARDRLGGEGFDCDIASDEAALLAAIAERDGAWLVIDGRHFTADQVAALASKAALSLMIDDHGALERYPVDIIVNPNLYAEAGLYDGRCAATATRLCGPRFALLRAELRRAITDREPGSHGPTRILLTLGGSDPHRLTGPLAATILSAAPQHAEVTAVIGPAAQEPELPGLDPGDRARLTILRQPEDWPAVLAASDLAVSAAGTTLLELAALGVPTLWVGNNDGETAAARRAEAEGYGRYLGPVTALDHVALAKALALLLDDPPGWAVIADAGRRLVDGAGAQRVVETMLALSADRGAAAQ